MATTKTPKTDGGIASRLVGQRTLVRTSISGVSIGTIRDIEIGPGGGVTVVLDDSIRVHSWTGEAFTCSELAAGKGVIHAARNPDGFVMSDSGAELIPVSDEAWERLCQAAHFGAK